ncbi:MAG TPA: DUF4345 family protein [Myxococcota bacterium]|nr:DUF4345 family protein [Myxococcota bacterium]
MSDAQRFARLVLAAGALAFAAPGACFLLWPDRFAALLGIAHAGSLARSDVRAVFGGLELGVGVVLAACALRRERRADGLALLLATAGAMLAARLLSLARDGSPGPLGAALGAIETLLVVSAAVGWRRLRAARLAASPARS